MDFRYVLTKLDGLHTHGIAHFDSRYLAILLGSSTRWASKYLSRLFKMGFLKRTRHKRRCFTRKGNFCSKGYQYEYTFSRQGEQYVAWMREKGIETLSNKAIIDAANYLSEDVKEHIANSILLRGGMRYKGPNRSLQTAGIALDVLPALTKKLEEAENNLEEVQVQRDRLLTEKINLEKGRHSLKKKLEVKALEIMDLSKKLQQMEQIAYKLSHTVLYYMMAWKIFRKVTIGISSALYQLLYLKYPTAAPTYKDDIIKLHKKKIADVDEYLTKAEKELDEVRKICASTQI